MSPRRSAETTDPEGSVPAACGSSRSASAARHDRSRDEIWRPVEWACRPSARLSITARWYSGRSGSRSSALVVRHTTRRASGCDSPRSARSAGRTSSSKQTSALTGLPGSANTSIGAAFASAPRRTVAKVAGFPGFISTRPNRSAPRRSSAALNRSRSPMDTPPEQINTSAPAASAASRAESIAASVSRRTPRSVARAPAAAAAAISIGRFESYIWDTPSGGTASRRTSGSTSSSPVEATATCGCRVTRTQQHPWLARRPTSAGPSRSPRASTVVPAAMSEPVARTSFPGGTGRSITMRRTPAGRAASSATTASAPAGSGAPVVTYAACLGESGAAFAPWPARDAPVSSYSPAPSTERTA